MANWFIHKYSKFIVNHYFFVIFLSLIVTGLGFSTFGMIQSKSFSVDEILPSTFPAVEGINKLSANLGGGESTAFMVVIELEAEEGSQIIDIRDPQIVRYTYLLGEQIKNVEDVTGVNSLGSSIYSLNGDFFVNDLNGIKEMISENENVFSRIVNDKYSLTILRVYANEGFDVDFLVNEVTKIIENTEKPVGIKVQLAGEEIARKVSEDLTTPDSAKTTKISLIAIVVILLFTFQSVVYGALPLFTIIFGVLWTLSFIALSGLRMSSFTAGAISMIVGIGIDFGIQTIMRFRQELAKANPVLAMEKTLENVLQPMFITTVAAFIGFWSMTLGDFSVLGELGKMMAIGVVFCFLAAATIVPAVSLWYELHKPKVKFNSPLKIMSRLIIFMVNGGKMKK